MRPVQQQQKYQISPAKRQSFLGMAAACPRCETRERIFIRPDATMVLSGRAAA